MPVGNGERAVAITVVIDNTALVPKLAKQWGLSFWIEAGDARVLLDCGASRTFLSNAASLGLSLADLDAIVVSHGHYDHTGTLAHVLAAAPGARLVVHPAALGPRYNLEKGGKHRPIGLPEASLEAVRREPHRTTWAAGPTQVGPGVWACGPVPRRQPLEGTEPTFFLDEACTVRDHVVDDQAIWIETPTGLVILTGCAHAGLINTVEYVRTLVAARSLKESAGSGGAALKVRAVFGGFHLLAARKDRLEATAGYLESLELENCGPCHCTGKRATDLLRARLGRAFADVGSGFSMSF